MGHEIVKSRRSVLCQIYPLWFTAARGRISTQVPGCSEGRACSEATNPSSPHVYFSHSYQQRLMNNLQIPLHPPLHPPHLLNHQHPQSSSTQPILSLTVPLYHFLEHTYHFINIVRYSACIIILITSIIIMFKRMNKRVSVVEPLPGWDDKEAVIDTRSPLII